MARIQGASIRIEAELLGAASYHMNMLAFLLNVIAPAVNLRSALRTSKRSLSRSIEFVRAGTEFLDLSKQRSRPASHNTITKRFLVVSDIRLRHSARRAVAN